jgi:hypothetical protein
MEERIKVPEVEISNLQIHFSGFKLKELLRFSQVYPPLPPNFQNLAAFFWLKKSTLETGSLIQFFFCILKYLCKFFVIFFYIKKLSF